jgi:uncharacterized protein YjbI with pentapeptide repeats
MAAGITELSSIRPPGLEAFVRPRFDDGTFDEPLPLGDHFLERFLDGPPDRPPRVLVITGPRGSGRTTALRWLMELARLAGRRVVTSAPRVCALPKAESPSASREAIGFLDLTPTPVVPEDWAVICARLQTAVPFLEDLVVAAPDASSLGVGRLSDDLQVACLAPWSSDDLLELLGSPGYRPLRPGLFRLLSGPSALRDLLDRPRTAWWLVEAARALLEADPERDLTGQATPLAALYAELLDHLHPQVLELLLGMSDPALRFGQLMASAGRLEPEALDQAGALFSLGHGALRFLATWSPDDPPEPPDDEQHRIPVGSLVLPGLQHFVQAGRCLQRIAVRSEHQPVELTLWRPEWLPYVPELITPAARTCLRTWISEGRYESAAASMLWACGETPALDRPSAPGPLLGLELPPAPRALAGAELAGVRVQGARLREACLDQARLSRAHLHRADLRGASLRLTVARGAVLDRADLSQACLDRANLRRARLRQAELAGAQLTHCDLYGAVLAGAALRDAKLSDCDLTRADLSLADLDGALLFSVFLRGADLTGAQLEVARLRHCDLRSALLAGGGLGAAVLAECDLRGADLRGADLALARLTTVDLRGAAVSATTNLEHATLDSCQLGDSALCGLRAQGAVFQSCDLSAADLGQADLRDARFEGCRAHEVAFEGADLRQARFEGVTFHAGSSRSGILTRNDAPALEGNMTGYYQEGTTDDAWAPPESIRVANFQGADLRGARFEATDLFRVDLRGARLDPETRAQAVRAGAVLER